MKNYVVYSPLTEQYVEVWKGLPDFEFERTKSRGGFDSLVYEKDGNYIWVTHDAFDELQNNPNAILVANMQKTCNGKINAYCVSTPQKAFGRTLKGSDLENIIERAKEVND